MINLIMAVMITEQTMRIKIIKDGEKILLSLNPDCAVSCVIIIN